MKYKLTKIWYDDIEIIEADSEREARQLADEKRLYCDEIITEELEEI